MSFWHNENIDVSGKLLAVIGTGLTISDHVSGHLV
jgi:hypothetical protein